MIISQLISAFLAAILAAILSAGIIWATKPLLLRHALARPNARSSHRIPTPQGAGIAVIAATLMAAGTILAVVTDLNIPAMVFGASLFIAIVGFADDVKPISVLPRLLLQAAAVGAMLYATSGNVQLVPACPLWIERGLLLFAGLWFVNLVNFMDGLDWMTIAEVIPVTGAITILGLLGEIPAETMVISAALCGAMLGFAPFNRPVAKIFLGDVGSLPIGLLLAWCLLQLAYHQQFAAALLLPLYYLSDATITLLRRIARRERFWVAHRSHFYQRATDNGFSVLNVVGEVFALNVGLAILAIVSVEANSVVASVLALLTGFIAVVLILHRFSGRQPSWTE
jgi:UDP-N-acetylmuramyl pentapeptide phosphotransferase/UDP-N-acetylglucosamine-1-phosphate transferase